MYSIVFVVWTQWASLLTPFVSGIYEDKVVYKTLAECEKNAEMLSGAIPSTDVVIRQYSWREAVCQERP